MKKNEQCFYIVFFNNQNYMSLVMRKPAYAICKQQRCIRAI